MFGYLEKFYTTLSNAYRYEELTPEVVKLIQFIYQDEELNWSLTLSLPRELVIQGLVKSFETPTHEVPAKVDKVFHRVQTITHKVCPVIAGIYVSYWQTELLISFIHCLHRVQCSLPMSVKDVIVGREACRILTDFQRNDTAIVVDLLKPFKKSVVQRFKIWNIVSKSDDGWSVSVSISSNDSKARGD